jgi:hypothetical protein
MKRSSFSSLLLAALAGGGICLASPAAGVVVSPLSAAYDNFGSGDTYNDSQGPVINGPSAPTGSITQGYQFTALDGGFLDSVMVGAKNVGGTNAITFTLTTDVGGLPGAPVESWSVADLSYHKTPGTPTTTLTSVLHPTLTSGTSYFLIASAAGDAQDYWYLNSVGASGMRVRSMKGAAFTTTAGQPQAVFRVMVSAIPEPSTYALLGGLAALGAVVVRRRLRR